MISNRLIPVGFVVAAAFAALVAAPRVVGAQATKMAASFTATTQGMNPGAGQSVKIDVLRWSTDAEIEKLVSAFKEKGEAQWPEALQALPTAGYLWTSGESLGYSLRYTKRYTLPDGSERIVVVTDRPLGSWGREVWKATGPMAVASPFGLVELRIQGGLPGEGKASLAGKVVVDSQGKGVELENYASAPVLFRGVRRAGPGAAAPRPSAAPSRPSAAPPKPSTAPPKPSAAPPNTGTAPG